MQNMKAIGDNEMICHKPYQKIEDLSFSVTKVRSYMPSCFKFLMPRSAALICGVKTFTRRVVIISSQLIASVDIVNALKLK